MTDVTSYDIEEGLKGDEKIIAEATRRFHYCEQWESNARKLFLDDLKFANADSDNHYQWPNNIRQSRDINQRPCLTINRTRQHNLQIKNDARQNKAAIKVDPVGGEASYEAAQIFEGVIRSIEYQSNATAAYDVAVGFQVDAGIGYWRVATDYAGDDSFDQEIFIRVIKDPLNVYLDPDATLVDRSDMRFAFVFDDMPRDQFKIAYPKYKDLANQSVLGNQSDWFNDDHVRVAEYFRAVPKERQLIAFTNPETGEQVVVRKDEIEGGMQALLDQVIDDPSTKRRTVVETEIEHFLIIADKIAERNIWPGRYIPIVPIVGEEITIDGHMDRKGHTRAMKDPQRIYNYFSSSAVENLALQSKSPFIAAARAIEGLETYWESANTINYSVLPYNHMDDEGNIMPPPERAAPPVQSTGYLEAMQTAREEMIMVSGQEPSNFGAPGNEQSGKAINERQRSGERATYHFVDNFALGLRHTGKILIDLIPKIYDTPRVKKIMAEDGTQSSVYIDPNAEKAHITYQLAQDAAIHHIFNPNLGKYEVRADVGPGYATKRQEAFNAFSQIVSQNRELVGVVGDLLFKNADFPGADKIAERLERMVPAQAKGEGPTPEMEAAQQQLVQMQQANGKLLQALTEERIKLKAKDQQKDIDVYKAITDRLGVLEKHLVSPRQQAQFLHDLAIQEHASNLQIVTAASQPDLEVGADV